MTALVRVPDDQVKNWPSRLRAIYYRAYDEEPYNYTEADADEFVERMSSQLEHPHFRLIAALEDGEVAGFSYGYQFPTDRWWRGARTAPPNEVAAGTKFAVIEIVVDRPFRGRRIAKQLMDHLLLDQIEDWGVLLAKPGALAHDMYQRWGWTIVGEVQSYPHWPVDDALVINLDAQRNRQTKDEHSEDSNSLRHDRSRHAAHVTYRDQPVQRQR